VARAARAAHFPAPLGKRAEQEFVRRVLGDVAPEKMDWLLDHAQGNPFYLEELVRAAAAGGDLSQIPDTVLGTVQVRFDAVGEGSKLVLRAASIFGQSFRAAGVKALVGDMNDDDVDRWLQILCDKEILFSRPAGAARQHVFRHGLLHQAAYAMLSPKEEVNGHFLAGHFLEEQGERDAIVLADHFEKGQKPERAVRWLRVAANQAMEVDDLKAALDRVERGVRLGAGGDDLAELRVVEAEARYWKGEYVEAERAAREGRSAGSQARAAGDERAYRWARGRRPSTRKSPRHSECPARRSWSWGNWRKRNHRFGSCGSSQIGWAFVI
jgi:predicted ATPase